MKLSKVIFLMLIAFVTINCDEETINAYIPQNIPIPFLVDVDALLAANLPGGTEVSDFADFGQDVGIPNINFTTVLNWEDEVSWEASSISSQNDQIFMRLEFNNQNIFNFLELVVPEGEDPDYYDSNVPRIKARIFNAAQENDLQFKYSVVFYVVRNGVQSESYLVDPKIKIKSRNSRN